MINQLTRSKLMVYVVVFFQMQVGETRSVRYWRTVIHHDGNTNGYVDYIHTCIYREYAILGYL